MSDENGSAGAGNPAGDTPPPAAPATPPWYAREGMAPEQVTQLGEVVQAKGWKHPGDALMSYVNLEKAFGADKAGRTILAPKGDDDTDGWNAVYERLGRPKSPTEYQVEMPDGANTDFLNSFLPVFHEVGLNQKAVQRLVAAYTEAEQAASQAAEQAFVQQTEQDYGALRKEWGLAADQNEELARRAVAKFGQQAGLDGEGLEALERAIGTGPLLKLFHSIGASFAEGTFVAGDNPGGGKLTPAQAQTRINSKFADAEFMSRYTNPDPKIRQGAIDEMMELQRQAHPELAA